MNIKLFIDGATLEQMESLGHKVDGWTFNPSLMKKLGITNYREFAAEVLARAYGKPVSFEVLADDFDNMREQAYVINGLGPNVWVKVPIITSNGDSACPLIHELSAAGVKVNITAVLSEKQCMNAWTSIHNSDVNSFVSVFAGRIADTGKDPAHIINRVVNVSSPQARILWASAREVYNVVQAERCGASIITLSPELFGKLAMFGKDLEEYSRETVAQFVKDAEGIQL